MIPRLSFEEVTQMVQRAVRTEVTAPSERAAGMPLIPPRTTPTVNTVMKSTDDPSWFVVISPRETRGLAGPLSVSQLKQMYKVNEITDRTLVWQEGEPSWQQLVHHSFLRSQLIYLPILPPRVGSYNEELAIFDPIVDVPMEAAESLVPLKDITPSKACKQCGNIAAFHCARLGEQTPDLFRLRTEVGTNEYASEVLPGFLWIGSAQSVKHRSIITLGFTLMINCTKNMKSPQPQPPHYRCQHCPLPEAPTEDFGPEEMLELLEMLERCFDWIELERTAPEMVARGDLPPAEWRGATDALGQPIKGAAEKLRFRHKLAEGDKAPPSRVLIWSKFGTDRSSFVAATYLIRSFGISIERAMAIVKVNRAETKISPAFFHALKLWEAKFVLGLFLCVDCADEKARRLAEVARVPALAVVERDAYDVAVELMTSHLPRLLVGQEDEEVVHLGPPDEYLLRVPTNGFAGAAWSGLVDLDLSDRRLGDRTVAFVLQLLAGAELLAQVRVLNLRNNRVSLLATKALLVSLYPKVSAEPDDEYYLLDESLDPTAPASALMALDLSHNPQLEESSARYLALLLRQCRSLMTLSLFGCHMEDDLVAELVSCLIKPTAAFSSFTDGCGPHDDDSAASDHADLLCNESITDLDLGRNKLGVASARALTSMFKQNAVLAVLRVEVCASIAPRDWRAVCGAIRIYNTSLTQVSMHSNALSVKTCEHLAGVTSSLHTRLERLRLPMCGLRDLHAAALAKPLSAALHLRVLDLSCNDIGDGGVDALCAIVRGTRTADGACMPPLLELDLNSCGLQPPGCAKIVAAVAARDALSVLDLSNNAVGPKNDDFLAFVGQTAVTDLRLNYCKLRSSLAEGLFRLLAHRSRSHVGDPSNVQSLVRGRLLESVRFLGLAGNEIGDSTAEALCELLAHNISLESLDLGFNAYTNSSAAFFQYATQVSSESSEEKKVYPLHVNLVGNKCDPYLLGAPGAARSKFNFHFGVQANLSDPAVGGYAHLESRVRGKFFVQKQLEEVYRQSFPAKPFHHLT